MSHSTVLVLLQNPNGEDVKELVAEALAPFDENKDVPMYQKDCYCIGSVAREEADEKAGKKFGTIVDLRKSFKNKKDKSDAAWQEHIKPYVEYRDSLIASHPDKDKPDPECGFYTKDYHPDGHKIGERFGDGSGCGGTGKYLTTYNPQSKWDWYVIGGRWQGDLDPDYDRVKDDRNYSVCRYCKGTGDRPDLTPPEWKKECGGCNSCHGTGKSMNWTLAPHDEGNIKPVCDILVYVPFAILTPDGRWHERGKMGWWGLVIDEE
jgi:hypothetical protein